MRSLQRDPLYLELVHFYMIIYVHLYLSIYSRVSELKIHIELTHFVQPGKIEIDANERTVNENLKTVFSFAPYSILSLTICRNIFLTFPILQDFQPIH